MKEFGRRESGFGESKRAGGDADPRGDRLCDHILLQVAVRSTVLTFLKQPTKAQRHSLRYSILADQYDIRLRDNLIGSTWPTRFTRRHVLATYA